MGSLHNPVSFYLKGGLLKEEKKAMLTGRWCCLSSRREEDSKCSGGLRWQLASQDSESETGRHRRLWQPGVCSKTNTRHHIQFLDHASTNLQL